MTEGLKVIPSLLAGFAGDIFTAIFQVDVPNAVSEALEAGNDIAIARTEGVVAVSKTRPIK